MANLNALQAAETLDVWTATPRVLRPDLPNPATEGGFGLELVTDLTVNELRLLHREKLIALTYYANVLAVYCAQSEQPPQEHIDLDDKRNQTDMIWHTDHVQRENGSVNIIVGQSSVPTGIAPKHVITKAARRLTNGNDVQWPMKYLYGHWLDFDELQMLYSDKTAYYLHYLHAITLGDSEELEEIEERDLLAIRAAFWDDIQAINTDPNILWFGNTPAEQAGKQTALFVGRTCFHNRGYMPAGSPPRDGNKHRLELRPTRQLRMEIDDQIAHLRYDQTMPQQIDAKWFKAL